MNVEQTNFKLQWTYVIIVVPSGIREVCFDDKCLLYREKGTKKKRGKYKKLKWPIVPFEIHREKIWHEHCPHRQPSTGKELGLEHNEEVCRFPNH